MREHISRALPPSRSKKLKTALSRDTQRIVDCVWKQAEAVKKHTTRPRGFRHNEFELPAARIAAWTGFPETSCRKIRDELVKHKWLKKTSLPSGKTAYRCIHEKHRVTPRKGSILQTYRSKLSKQLKNSFKLLQISSQDKEVKGTRPEQRGLSVPRETRTPRPFGDVSSYFSSLLEKTRRETTSGQVLYRVKYSKTHHQWAKIGPGIHLIRSDGLVDLTRPLVSARALDELVAKAVSLTREASGDAKLDEGWLTRSGKGGFAYGAGRTAMLEHLVREWKDAPGRGEGRLAAAKKAVLDNVRGYLERQHTRKTKKARCYWSLSNCYSLKQNPQTKRRTDLDDARFREDKDNAWRFTRRRNQEWHHQGRILAENAKSAAKEKELRAQLAVSNRDKNIETARLIRMSLAGDENAKAKIQDLISTHEEKNPGCFSPPQIPLPSRYEVFEPGKPEKRFRTWFPVPDRLAPLCSLEAVARFDPHRESREIEKRRLGQKIDGEE